MKTLNPEAASKLNPDDLQKVDVSNKIEGYIDPATLRPHWVKVQVKGMTSSEITIQEFVCEFKWLQEP